MGMTCIEGVASGTDDQRVTVRFLVDSGATYSLLPYDDWQAIGLAPKRSMTFSLADGTAIERQISECHIEIAQARGTHPSSWENQVIRLCWESSRWKFSVWC